MKVKGFNRVELVVREDQIDDAVRQFNELLGTKLPTPHPIRDAPVLSSTDFDGHVEFVAPRDGQGPFAEVLAEHGAGQVGPLVWEIEDLDAARDWLTERGYRITYEYDSGQGNDAEASTGVRQLVLDREQWFGFLVTLMERSGG